MRVLISMLFCLGLVGCAESDWDMVSRHDFPSADGRHVAAVFEMCSYNTTGYWPQISLLHPGQRLGSDGNVLAGGPGDSFTARWISARELAVEYHTDSEWRSYPPSATNIDGVTITFKKL
jgi:hypothetical protein